MAREYLAITIDLTSLCFLLVLFCAGAFLGWTKNLRGRLFLSMTAVWILALATDALAWNADLSPTLTAFDWFFGVLSCCFAEIETPLFVYYLLTLARERGKEIRWTLGHAAVIVNSIGILLTVFFAVIGKLYVAENGKLLPGNHYFIVGLTPIITVVGLVAFVIFRWHMLGKRVAMTALIYVTLPFIGYILEVFILEWFPASMCMNSLALMIVYIVLQSHEINATRERERLLQEISSIDVMTGLSNRRAYHTRISHVDPEERFGAVFCDMNALKYTNDNFGHEAGDQLLKDFAVLISDHFGRDNVFRISGDEFVVLFTAPVDAPADKLIADFRKKVSDLDSIASVGCAFGYGRELNMILDEAEKRMYEGKDRYYERTGKPRRR